MQRCGDGDQKFYFKKKEYPGVPDFNFATMVYFHLEYFVMCYSSFIQSTTLQNQYIKMKNI